MRSTKTPALLVRHAAAVGFAAALTFAAGAVRASPTFPAYLQEKLNMPCTPQCVLCHRTEAGGRTTATKPFGSTVVQYGASAGDTNSLGTAIDQIERQGTVDSDGDGMLDITELREGSDPDVKGAGHLCGPEYGCACGTPRSSTDSLAALLAAAVATSLVWNARRRGAGRR